ncbi:MAG: helix-turn-helix domain-containing protein [Actinomycetes bacterium]|jgi:predicted transcriptional regulator
MIDWTVLSDEEVRCLRLLLRSGAMTVSEVAIALEFTEAQVERVLDGLVERELAEKDTEAYRGVVQSRTYRSRSELAFDPLAPGLFDDL